MMLMNALGSNDHSSKSTNILSMLHRWVCIFGTLVTICCLFRCFLSIANALQDVDKFEHTGTFQYFLFFLDQYYFPGAVCTFSLMMAELLLYITQYRRAEEDVHHWGKILYFALILAFHIVVWLQAKSIPAPAWPYEETDEVVMQYLLFGNMTVFPPIAYCIMYILNVRKVRKMRKPRDCSPS